MGVGAVAGGIGAAASLGGALINSSASKSAADTQAAAATNAADIAHNQYLQTRSDLLPYNFAGQGAVGELSSLYGLPGAPTSADGSAPPSSTPSANATSEEAFLQNTPGYQFALTQGLKSIQSANIARGVSGAAFKGAANYATGLADQTYQQNLLQPLQYLGTLGEGAGAQTGVTGATLANTQAQATVGAGNALAAGTVGSANALSNGLSGLSNNYLTYSLLSNGGLGGGGGGGGTVDDGPFSNV